MEQPQQPQVFNQQQANQIMTIAALTRRVKVGANNFHWIAGLSIVNSLISAFGGGVTFVIGLGVTQLVDAFALIFSQDAPEGAIIFKAIGLALSVLIAAVFVLFGFFAGKAQRWAFITGMVLYALDAVLLLFFQDWIGFFFHLYFMWGLWSGLQALNEMQKFITSQPGAVMDFPKDIGAP